MIIIYKNLNCTYQVHVRCVVELYHMFRGSYVFRTLEESKAPGIIEGQSQALSQLDGDVKTRLHNLKVSWYAALKSTLLG